MVKRIHIILDDEEFEDLHEKKGDKTWKQLLMMKNNKAQCFVEHIEQHLREMYPEDAQSELTVKCKVCGKTIDEIYKIAREKAKEDR